MYLLGTHGVIQKAPQPVEDRSKSLTCMMKTICSSSRALVFRQFYCLISTGLDLVLRRIARNSEAMQKYMQVH